MSRERICTTPKAGPYHLRTPETFLSLQLHSQGLPSCHSWVCKAQPYPHILQFRCIFSSDCLWSSLTFFHYRFRECFHFCQVPAPLKRKTKKKNKEKKKKKKTIPSHSCQLLTQVGSTGHGSREGLLLSHAETAPEKGIVRS